MHLHSYTKSSSHLHPFTSTATFPTLIPDSKHFKETMENMQKRIDALRGDVDQVTDKLDRVLEMLASLGLPSHQVIRVDDATVGANPSIDPSLSKVVWPSFGSSSGHTSAVAHVTQETMATNNEFLISQPRTHQVQPSFALPQSLDDHKNAHQGDNSKGESVVSPSEETRQKFKAIEDKLRMMESLLPSNVSPPHSHSCSTVPARAPCFNHQYPTVVQPQQSQGFPKQAIQTPLNYSQSGQFAHNLGHQQNQHGPRRERRNVHYDRIPMLYGQILPRLLYKGLVQLKPLDPVSPPYPPGFDENARCDYHNGSPGHNVENCRAFKHKVQELIDQKLLTFKEDEANVATSKNGSTSPTQIPCLQYPYRAAAQHQQPQGYSFQVPVNLVPQRTQQVQQTQQRAKKVFDPIPVSCSQLLSYLVHNGMITPRALKPMIAPFPNWFDPKAKCEFHLGAEGHTIDNCKAFKRKVQELVDQKLLTFKEGEPNCEG
ncbi:hypothetical protein QL285_032245 [Trifolium repens]|nr:hypothetical protein QL285_032245 [Trifolium repens]